MRQYPWHSSQNGMAGGLCQSSPTNRYTVNRVHTIDDVDVTSHSGKRHEAATTDGQHLS
jgi:hypothetical protein